MASVAAIFDDLLPVQRRKLLAIYQRAQRELSQMALHPTGGTTASAEWRANAARQKLAQIDKIVKQLKEQTAAYAGKAIPAAAAAGAASARQDIRRINNAAVLVLYGNPDRQESLAASFNVINHDAVRVIAQEMAADLYKAADSMGASAKRILHQTSQARLSEAEIDQVIAGRLISGDRTLATQLLRDQLIRAHEGRIITVIDRNGDLIHYDAGHYAGMVVRTKTAQAITQGNLLQYDREGIELVVIDGRVSKNPCTEFLGKVYSIKGNHPDYPPLSSLPGGGPPFHPNCSKGIAAYIPELATADQRRAAEPEPETEQIARQWRQQPSTAMRTYNDLQRRQAAQERMRGINKGSGPRQRVSANDDPRYLASRIKEMGVTEVDLAKRSDLGAEIFKATQQAVSAGASMPQRIIVDARTLKGDPGGYDPSDKTLYLNPSLTPKSMREKATAKGPEGDKTWSSAHPLHILYHEFSHAALHQQLGGAEYQQLRDRPWFAGEQVIASRVSGYAARKPIEFVSEYRAARMAGRIFPQPIIDLYTRLAGQRWTP